MRPTSLIATGTVRQRDLVRDAADCRPQGDGAVPVVDHGQVLAGTGEEIHDRLAGRRVGRSGKGVGSRRLTIAVHYLSRTPTPRGVTCSSPESLTAGTGPYLPEAVTPLDNYATARQPSIALRGVALDLLWRWSRRHDANQRSR